MDGCLLSWIVERHINNKQGKHRRAGIMDHGLWIMDHGSWMTNWDEERQMNGTKKDGKRLFGFGLGLINSR